jgi:hypothetical protein
VPEYDGLGLDVELVAFGLDLHGLADGLPEAGAVPRVAAQDGAQVQGVLLA